MYHVFAWFEPFTYDIIKVYTSIVHTPVSCLAHLWVDSLVDMEDVVSHGIGHCRIRCLCVSHVCTSVTEPLPAMTGALSYILALKKQGVSITAVYTEIAAFSNSRWHFHFVLFFTWTILPLVDCFCCRLWSNALRNPQSRLVYSNFCILKITFFTCKMSKESETFCLYFSRMILEL